MYNIAIYLYMLLLMVAAPFHRKARQMVTGRWKTFRKLRHEIDPEAKYVWFHAASLGEFEQGRPLMERLRREHPEYKILLTFFSPSGYEVRKNYEGADVVCYLPLDTPGNVHSFFRLVNPVMAVFIKYEFWYNTFRACYKKGIPIYSVSSIFRSNKIFFRWYGGRYVRVLKYVTHFFVQDEESVRLLETRGIHDNVTIVGDTRFDRVLDIRQQARELPLVQLFAEKNPRILVAGSSWPVDEEFILPYIDKRSNTRLILAPHVVSEEHLSQIEKRIHRKSLRYSQATPENVADADCLIIDCYGLLSSIYRYGQVAYVGGGFGVGIHNVPEAAVYGIPVLIGPNNKKFREAQDLLRMGGCVEIDSGTLFNAMMDQLMDNDTLRTRKGSISKDYIVSNAGAADMIFRKLFPSTKV